jgi:hypothetical protein
VRGEAGMVRRGSGIRPRSLTGRTEELLGVRSIPSPKPLFIIEGDVPPIDGDEFVVMLTNPLSALP